MDVTRYFGYTVILLYMFVHHIFMTSPLLLDFVPILYKEDIYIF